MRASYRMCVRCVMDTSVPDIEFDAKGICNYCKLYEARIQSELISGEVAQQRLDALANTIKAQGAKKPYDCVIGVSGGVDSTYVAYLVKRKLGLRPFAIHLDNGWNSELAVNNIERTMKNLDIDLYTNVLDWDEFKDLQKSFLRSSVANCEIPTDHAIIATLFKSAVTKNIQYILSGDNIVTEAIMPNLWMYDARDLRLLRSIHRRFGTVKLRNYPTINLFQLFYYIYFKKIKYIPILNLFHYVKSEAKQILKDELGWRDYGGKHRESIYTRFFQSYILPKKFNIDKRIAHLSCLIMSGQVSRDEALTELEQPAFSSHEVEEDEIFVTKKLGVTIDEFQELLKESPKSYADYPNNSFIWLDSRKYLLRIKQFIRRRAINYLD
jgi:N-acetyl sugar amidotransferase